MYNKSNDSEPPWNEHERFTCFIPHIIQTEHLRGEFEMNISICDDDEFSIRKIKDMIIEYYEVNHLTKPNIYIFNDGLSLLQSDITSDIVYLDVEMPGLDGIQAGRMLMQRNKNTLIIVITSYMEYLDDAMRFHVFRYLSKPIEQKRFNLNLKDAITECEKKSKTICIETNSENLVVSTLDIIFIEIIGRKSLVHTTLGTYHSPKPLSSWKSVLDEDFFYQPHRSYIINLHYVSSFSQSAIFLCGSKYTAYLAERKYHAFKKHYLNFLEGVNG